PPPGARRGPPGARPQCPPHRAALLPGALRRPGGPRRGERLLPAGNRAGSPRRRRAPPRPLRMTVEDRILFVCARQELDAGHRERISELCRQARQAGRAVDWERLVATAERHGVAPIVGVNLGRAHALDLGLPPALALRLELALFENVAEKERDAARL